VKAVAPSPVALRHRLCQFGAAAPSLEALPHHQGRELLPSMAASHHQVKVVAPSLALHLHVPESRPSWEVAPLLEDCLRHPLCELS